MKAGDLKHRITLRRAVTITDSRGNRIKSYTDIASVMAGMKDVSGRDLYAALGAQAEDLVTFSIRWREDLDASCRIVRGLETYEIKQVNHLGYKRDFMQLKARQIREGA